MFGFDQAIREVKAGKSIQRAGWNGKGMFVFIQNGSFSGANPAEVQGNILGVSSHLFDYGDTGTATRMPCLCLRAANGETVVGWLASQTDMLAEDWSVVE